METKTLSTFDSTPAIWAEYDSAAEWCAKRNIKGNDGDPLPAMISAVVFDEISNDPESFRQRVRDCAHALAMTNK